MVIVLGYVASLGLGAASLGWWRHIVPFNMRLLHGYNRWQDKTVPRGIVVDRYFGTMFLAAMALAVFLSTTVEVVRSIS